jgi:hypothetical protein
VVVVIFAENYYELSKDDEGAPLFLQREDTLLYYLLGLMPPLLKYKG